MMYTNTKHHHRHAPTPLQSRICNHLYMNACMSRCADFENYVRNYKNSEPKAPINQAVQPFIVLRFPLVEFPPYRARRITAIPQTPDNKQPLAPRITMLSIDIDMFLRKRFHLECQECVYPAWCAENLGGILSPPSIGLLQRRQRHSAPTLRIPQRSNSPAAS